MLTAVADQSSDPDGLKEGTIKHLVAETRSYASDALDDGKINKNDEDGIPDDCVLFHQSGQAGTENMLLTVTRLNMDAVEIKMDGGPANPLAIFAEGFGSLDWDFTIGIDTSGGTPQWTLTGRHDGFPAYEIYLNDTEIYRYSPGSPPYEFLTHVRKLLGRKDVNVGNLSGSLP